MDGALGKIERVIGHGKCREPKLAVNLLAVSGESRKKVFHTVLGLSFGHRLPFCLDDLEVLVVHPDYALKVLFALTNCLGPD